MKSLMLMIALSVSFVSCNSSTTGTTVPGDYVPTPHYVCEYVWALDPMTGQNNYVYACFWTYYSLNGDTQVELDLSAEVADTEEFVLQKNAEYYAEKFSLSTEQSYKVAKQVVDLNSLEERSLEDIADFAKNLYGIDTTKAISAAGKAQLGDFAELDAIVNTAAENFNTSSENMKALIKELHGKALNDNGIEL